MEPLRIMTEVTKTKENHAEVCYINLLENGHLQVRRCDWK